MARVALVIPCFNEAERIDAGAFTTFELPGHELRFCFVDDGSTDATLRVIEAIRDAPRALCVSDVVHLEKNGGKAEAVRRGIVHALERQPDYVGFWDADLAAPLSELHAFVAILEERRDLTMVLGSRVKMMGHTIDRKAWRHYFGRIAATLISATLDLPVYDTQCGHKLFRVTDTLAHVFATPFSVNWLFDVEILARYLTMDPRGHAVAASIYEQPLSRWVDVRGSKVKSRDFVRGLREIATIKRHYRL